MAKYIMSYASIKCKLSEELVAKICDAFEDYVIRME
jgi:hypothetical protein